MVFLIDGANSQNVWNLRNHHKTMMKNNDKTMMKNNKTMIKQ
jgi:hypothetical protein